MGINDDYSGLATPQWYKELWVVSPTVLELGSGGQSLAAQELGWNRTTIRQGIKELKSGITCVDNNSAKGRKKAEEHLYFNK